MHLLLWSGFNASRGSEIPQALQWGKENNRRNKTEKWTKQKFRCLRFSSVQCFIRVQLFATPWTAHARLPCPSPAPRACPNSCPLSSWCHHPTVSSPAIPFSSCPQSFPASGSFLMSQFFASGCQNIGVSASASVLPMNIQDWFPLGWTGWISCLRL